MADSVYRTAHVRFRSFELDLHTRELFRNGVRLKVQGHPIDLLEMLVEHPGELVSREELRKRLWPEHTFVDFEHGLNSTIKRLRDALGDNPEHPRFIETLPRLGYRFVAEVERDADVIPDAEESTRAWDSTADLGECSDFVAPPGRVLADTTPTPTVVKVPERISRFRWFIFAAGALFLAAGAGFYRYVHKPLPPPHIGEIQQLTRDVRWQYKRPLGVDRGRVYFAGIPRGLFAVASSGEIETVPLVLPWSATLPVWAWEVSPDGAYFLAWPLTGGPSAPLWVFATTGKPVRYVAEISCAGWSPDSKQVIYSTVDGQVYTVPTTSGEPRWLFTSKSGAPWFFSWSPDGTRIRYSTGDQIWEVASNGTGLHEFLPAMQGSVSKYCGRWTPDGAFYIFASASKVPRNHLEGNQLWAVDERSGRLRKPSPPVQLTFGPIQWISPYISPDSRTIFATGSLNQGELVRFNKPTGQFERYMNGVSAEWLDFSRDGRYVAYVTYPEQKIWRANRDGTDRILLAEPEGVPWGLRWSPDGARILFLVSVAAPYRVGERVNHVYILTSRGEGKPQQVQFPPGENPVDPTWSPDGRRLAYTVDPPDHQAPREVRILDLETHRSAALPPAPVPVRSPRWSPNGSYIFCSAEPAAGFAIFDTRKQKWNRVSTKGQADYPNWASNGQAVYFLGSTPLEYGVYRISISTGQLDRVVELKDFRATGSGGPWLGVDPEDNPLLLRDVGTVEIYSLSLERD